MSTRSSKADRVYLRIDKKLKGQIQSYAKRHNTTVSALAIRYFDYLLEEEKKQVHTADAEQF